MTVTRDSVLDALRRIEMPGTGRDLVEADVVRAVTVEGATVRFGLAVDPGQVARLEPVRAAAQAAVERLPGVAAVSALLTAHAGRPEPPSLKVGRHPTPQAGPGTIPGVNRIIAIASGKGGVGKSTLSANLAVALALEGKRTGLLDADFYGPSQPRMMGVSARPQSPDGKTIVPLRAHGVTMMSIGLMIPDERTAVVWRGPMLMGALQQMMGQVAWGELDALLIDMPPGTGDVQLTLAQKYTLTGAVVVSTPQDVALADARKAMDMFAKLSVPVLGLVENMSTYICPNCGHEEHIFGEGGVRAEAEAQGLPFLGSVPIDIGIRLAGDAGTPVVALDPDGPQARGFRAVARRLIEGGLV